MAKKRPSLAEQHGTDGEIITLEGMFSTTLPNDGVSMGNARTIPTSAVDPNPYQPRKDFNPEELRRLATSIRRRGQKQPIAVVRYTDESGSAAYTLIAGERRLRAKKLLQEMHPDESQHGEIDAVIFDSLAAVDMLADALAENTNRSNLPSAEVNAGVVALSELGRNSADIAEEIGRSLPTINKHLSIGRYDAAWLGDGGDPGQTLRERMRRRDITFTQAHEVASTYLDSGRGRKPKPEQLPEQPLASVASATMPRSSNADATSETEEAGFVRQQPARTVEQSSRRSEATGNSDTAAGRHAANIKPAAQADGDTILLIDQYVDAASFASFLRGIKQALRSEDAENFIGNTERRLVVRMQEDAEYIAARLRELAEQ